MFTKKELQLLLEVINKTPFAGEIVEDVTEIKRKINDSITSSSNDLDKSKHTERPSS